MSRPRPLHRMSTTGALGRCDAPYCDRTWSTLQTFGGVRRRLCRAHRRCSPLEVLAWSVPTHTDLHIPESRLVGSSDPEFVAFKNEADLRGSLVDAAHIQGVSTAEMDLAFDSPAARALADQILETLRAMQENPAQLTLIC